MKVLLDTNIILRLAEPNHPMYPLALNGINYLTQNRSDDEYLSLQTINSQISVSTIYEDVNLS